MGGLQRQFENRIRPQRALGRHGSRGDAWDGPGLIPQPTAAQWRVGPLRHAIPLSALTRCSKAHDTDRHRESRCVPDKAPWPARAGTFLQRGIREVAQQCSGADALDACPMDFGTKMALALIQKASIAIIYIAKNPVRICPVVALRRARNETLPCPPVRWDTNGPRARSAGRTNQSSAAGF